MMVAPGSALRRPDQGAQYKTLFSILPILWLEFGTCGAMAGKGRASSFEFRPRLWAVLVPSEVAELGKRARLELRG